MTITLEMDHWTLQIRGAECGIYGIAGDHLKPSERGRFKLWIDGDDDPILEGTSAVELEQVVMAAGAAKVVHWYEPK